MQRILCAAAAALLTALVGAQSTVVIPAPAAAGPGDTSNAFPWGTSAAGWGGLRLLATYAASNFTSQNITSPIVITELKWRPDDQAAAVTGGTFSAATVQMSTSPIGWAAATTNFPANHGANLSTVYSGAVVHTATPGPSGWTPQSWCVDIVLSAPFTYDPSQGDLVIDVDYASTSFSGGSLGQMDLQAANSNSSRVYASASYPATNGITTSYGPVVEVTFAASAGYASKARYGSGCINTAGESFYELFAAGTHDLGNSSMSLLNSGSGYVALANLATMYPTTSATPLVLADDSEVAVPLTTGWIPYGASGQATSLNVCSNGFVSVDSNGTGYTPAAATLLNATNTGWWCQHDYNPSIAGSGQVKWEETTTHVYVTWDNVYSYNSTGPGNTFQFQFEKYTGTVHVVWGSIDNTGNGHIVGYSEGGPSADPGSIDLSAVLPATFPVAFGMTPLAFDASARPVLGSSINLLTSSVPAGSPLGAIVLGLTEYTAGIPLAAIGMPGCFQYTSPDAVLVFLPSGTTASTPMAVSANPAFAGVRIKAQSVALATGANSAGVVASNGLRLVLDVN